MRSSFLKTLAFVTAASLCLGVSGLAWAQQPAAPQPATPAPRVLKMQSTWPAGGTLQENFKLFAERVDKLTGGALKIETMAGGQVVPQWSLGTIYKGMFDFMWIQCACILLVLYVPSIALWLPTTLTAQATIERMAPSSAEDAATENAQGKDSLEEEYGSETPKEEGAATEDKDDQ